MATVNDFMWIIAESDFDDESIGGNPKNSCHKFLASFQAWSGTIYWNEDYPADVIDYLNGS